MEIIKYPDGSSYVDLSDNIHETRVFRINSYEDLWHLNQYVDAYNFRFRVKPTIIIPCLLDSQADRRFGKSQSSGLKLICKFLNQMHASFKIFHPHNPEVIEALIDDVVVISNVEFISKVIENIPDAKYQSKKPEFYHNLIIMSPDAGAYKNTMKICDEINWQGSTYSASKVRVLTGADGMRIIQYVDRKDFRGKDVLIVDDLCVYGGTFKGLAQILRESNVGRLYLAVSHMTVQNLGEDPVTDHFDKVFTTNSKYDNYFCDDSSLCEEAVQTIDNLKIIKIF